MTRPKRTTWEVGAHSTSTPPFGLAIEKAEVQILGPMTAPVPRPKSRPAASRAAFWGEPVAAAACLAWPPLTQSRHLMMKLQAVGIVPRSITYSRGSRLRDWTRGTRQARQSLRATAATTASIRNCDSGFGTNMRQAEFFVAGSWMSLIAWLIPAADVPRGSG